MLSTKADFIVQLQRSYSHLKSSYDTKNMHHQNKLKRIIFIYFYFSKLFQIMPNYANRVGDLL
jgi:hypothetical protein